MRASSVGEQGRLWSAAPADWAELQEGFSIPLWRAMFRSVGVSAGVRLLDAGCGTGGASAMARDLGAIVHGIDASVAMVRHAAGRVPGGEFLVGDLQAIPYASGSFDVSFVASSLHLASDPAQAARELCRVTRDGGRVVVGMFGPRAEVEYGAILDAVDDLIPCSDGPAPLSLSEGDGLESLLSAADLEVVDAGSVPCPFVFADMESLWLGTRAAGSIQAAIAVAGPESVRRRIEQAADPFLRTDGTIRFETSFRYVTGRVG